MRELPREEWVCVEVHVSLDASSGSMASYLNGVLIGEELGFDTTVGGAVDEVRFGAPWTSNAQQPIDVIVEHAGIERREREFVDAHRGRDVGRRFGIVRGGSVLGGAGDGRGPRGVRFTGEPA